VFSCIGFFYFEIGFTDGKRFDGNRIAVPFARTASDYTVRNLDGGYGAEWGVKRGLRSKEI